MGPERLRRPGELTFSVLLLAFALAVLNVAHGISGFESLSSPGMFPMLAGLAMVVSGLVIVNNTRRMRGEAATAAAAATRFASDILPPRHLAFMALILAYMLGLERLGFLLSTFAFLFVSILFLYRRGVLVSLALSAGSLAAIYVVFRFVFTVVLPQGDLFR